MRTCIVLFLLFLFSACSKQFTISYDQESICSYFVRTGEPSKYCAYEKSFIIEVVDPVFKDSVVTYSVDELDRYKVQEGVFSIPRMQAHVFCKLKDKSSTYFLKSYDNGGLMYCSVQVPTKVEEYTLNELEQQYFSINFEKLVTNGYVTKRYVRRAPKELSINQFFFEANYYTPKLTAVAGGYKLQMDPCFKLQERLNVLGYKVVEDGILNESTMDAVRDFQLKNNLETWGLDLKTFQALGLMPEE